jgi:hypothetical protein
MDQEENKRRNALVPAPRGTIWPPPWLKHVEGGTAKNSPLAPPLPREWREAFEERAAIMEFDGQLPRAEAERLAMADTIQAMKRDGAT